MANDYSVILSIKLNEAQAQAEIIKALKQIEKNATINLNSTIKTNTLSSNIEKAQLRVENLKTKYSAFVNDPKLVTAWRNLFDQSKIIQTQQELTNLNSKIGVFEQQLEKAGKRQKSFTAEMQNNIVKMGTWMVLGAILASVMRSIKEIYTNVVEVNSAMTDLKKVTNETDTAYKEFLQNAADKAKELSANLSDVISATTAFSKLGYDIKDASALGDIAIMYANVGDGITDIDSATQNLISTMRGFGLQTSDAMGIVDKFNEISNNFSITASGIGEALKRSASSLATANNTLDESIALIVAANTVVQDPESVGTGLKTMSLRIRGAKADLEEMGEETDNLASSTSKLRDQFIALTGVDIMSDDNTFKSTYEILKGISKVFSSLSDTSQSVVLEMLFGKRQANIGAAILENFDIAENALNTSLTSAGSATTEYSKWLESIDAHVKSLSAAWQGFSVDVLNSSTVTTVIDALKILVEVLGWLEEHIGLINIALIALAGIAGAKTAIGLNALANGLNKLLVTMGLTTGAATTLSMALSVMIPVAALLGAIAIFNEINVTLDEQTQKVNDIKDKYVAVTTEIESLSAKKITSPLDNPLTENEQKRLDYLEQYKKDLEYIQATETQKMYKSQLFGEGDLFSGGALGESRGTVGNRAAALSAWQSPNYEAVLQNYSTEELQTAYNQLWADLTVLLTNKDKFEAALTDPAVLSDEALTVKAKAGSEEISGYIDKYKQSLDRLVEISGGAIVTEGETLEKLDEVTGAISATTEETNKFLEAAQSANDELQNAADAYEAVSDAVEDYNDAGFVTDDTLASLEKQIPGVISLLYDENGQLRDGADAAMESSDSLLSFLETVIQTQLVVAQSDYTNLVNQLGAASLAAVAAQQNVANLQAMLAQITGAKTVASKQAKKGGGSSSIYSKDYTAAKDYTEHMIKLSELRQKRMDEESGSYKTESQTQILYYQQLMDSTQAELNRLTKKGYDESNKEFRQLAQDYESYQNEIYDIAYNAWKQQQQAAVDAVEDQIDAENERWEAREKQLQHEIDQQQSLLSLEEKHLDTIGQVHEEIASLDKELATALTYPVGSDLSLFTQEEHDDLVAQLRDIEDEATALYDDYQDKLSEVSADATWELEGITDEFNRQYEILLKQYEISKADLAVARARRDLENVLNERNVAMLVNGVWEWRADPESVKQAVEAVYDAKLESQQALTDLYNTQKTQAIEEFISDLDMQKSAEEAAHDSIIDGLNDQIDAINAMSFVFDDFISAFMDGTEALKNAITPVTNPSSNPPTTTPKKGVNKAAYSTGYGAGTNRLTKVAQAYADGGVADYTGPAHMDGSNSAAELVLSSAKARQLYNLIFNTDDLVAMMASKLSRSMNPSFGGKYDTTSSSPNVTNNYINGVQIGGADGDLFTTLLQRNLPITIHN